MKILFLSNYFYPETFRGNDIAFYLASQGYDVTVLCNIPNYPEGHYFPGYGIFRKRRELINGVRVVRVPIIPRGDGGKLKMALNYVSGLICMYCYALHFAIWHKFDAIFVQQLSPVFIGLPAVLVKRFRGTPIYYWLLDLWPESLAAGGINNAKIINMVSKVCKHIYANCDRILVSSMGFRGLLVGRGVADSKIEYFPNWSEDEIADGELKDIPALPFGFRILFAGNVGEAQNFDNLMKVMLRTRNVADLHWIIVGDGRKLAELKKFVEENDLSGKVHLMGRFDISYMPSFFSAADALLVSLTDNTAFNSTLPAKVQAYMSASKPILGMMNGEGRDVIAAAKCGFSTAADDIDGFAALVEQVSKMDSVALDELGRNGKHYYDAHFTKSVCMQHLQEVLSSYNVSRTR